MNKNLATKADLDENDRDKLNKNRIKKKKKKENYKDSLNKRIYKPNKIEKTFKTIEDNHILLLNESDLKILETYIENGYLTLMFRIF